MSTGNAPIQVINVDAPTLPPIVPSDAPILPINSSHANITQDTLLAPTTSNINSSALRSTSRPITYVAFGRMRHFMRDEVKKSEATLQFRKESVHAMKDICDQFMHELMRVTIDVCTQREAAQRQAGLQVGSRTSISSFAQSSRTVGTLGTGEKRRIEDEPIINEPNKRINAFRPIGSKHNPLSISSSVDPPFWQTTPIPPVPIVTNINNIPNVHNENNSVNTTENNAPPKRSRIQQPNEESTAKARKVISELIEKTQRKLHTVLPEDIEQALRIMNLEHLLLSDPRSKDTENEEVEEINEMFFL